MLSLIFVASGLMTVGLDPGRRRSTRVSGFVGREVP
jgi:hypothetical protein